MASQNPAAQVNDRMTDIVRTHRPALVRFVQQFTRGRHHATEDVVQETIIRAWRHLDRLPEGEDEQRRWLFTVAHRLSIDNARRQKVRHADTTVAFDDVRGNAAPDDVASAVVAADSLRCGLAALAPHQREVVEELYVRNHTAQEAAEHLHLPLGTIRSRQHYAIRALRTAVLG
ncbi:sigma-70 family RNA polymerase sigma factor [Actinoplanes sp. Pm04-4]|uniref:Sigma-70 family RNA polymerase sigma factor n=1 Tax=Paractinoplanes pyxinae TaxID=2997416 RepID=A0ABT4AS04_9ACTN|nr:sigma-70 family RNA polymerase sigma factor [Actinoplanes pyxinae]MCY1137034.1 sigma-70 family RNA polymerase sigma factor [Actinoplanes pyxinae]